MGPPKRYALLVTAVAFCACATTKMATRKQCEEIFDARAVDEDQALDELRNLAEEAEEPVGDEPITDREVEELKRNGGDRGVFVRTCSQLPKALADCFRPEAAAAVCEERLFRAEPKQREVYEAAKSALAEPPPDPP
jgi:hypothetical protein